MRRSFGLRAVLVTALAVAMFPSVAMAAPPKEPAWFADSSIRLVGERDAIKVSWPARKNATKYRVMWAPSGHDESIPYTPHGCKGYCQHVDTTSTAVRLTSGKLSVGNEVLISSASGAVTRFRVFALNGSKYSRSTNQSFKGPRPWVGNGQLHPNNQMAAPLPAVVGTTVKVSSFNVLNPALTPATGHTSWGSRVPKLARQIHGTGSSIVGVQEATQTSKHVPGKIPAYESLLKALGPGWVHANPGVLNPAPKLPSKNAVRPASSLSWNDFDGRGVNVKAANATNQGARIYYKSNVWVQDTSTSLGVFTTGDTYLRGYVKDDAGTKVRSVSWVKLRSKTDNRTKVCVINAHLFSGAGIWTSSRRIMQMNQIISMYNNRTSTLGRQCTGVPTVMTGDMNTSFEDYPHGNEPIINLIRKSGFVDTKNAALRVNTHHSGSGGNFRSPHLTRGRQIDYVLTRGMGGAKEFWVNHTTPNLEGSDHFPVTATVVVPRGK